MKVISKQKIFPRKYTKNKIIDTILRIGTNKMEI